MSSPGFYLRICPLLLVTALGCSSPAEKLFEVSTDGSTRTGLLALEQGVVAVNEAGIISFLEPDGAVRWRVPIGRPLASRPVEARGVVVGTSLAGEWFGIMASSGKVSWQVPRQPVTRADLVTDGSRVFGVLTNGGVRAVDAATGAVLWNRPAPGKVGEAPLASPVMSGSSLVVALGEAGVVALQWADGALLWRSPVVARGMARSVDGGRVFVAGADKKVQALDATSGETLWSQALEAEVTTGPQLVGDRLYLGLGTRLVGLDPASGEPVWSAELDAPVGPVAQVNSTLLVPTSGAEGRLFLFHLPATKPRASVRVDSPLRNAPVAFGDRVLVPASDGRVLGYRLQPPRG